MSERFALHTIEVLGAHRTSEDEVRAQSGLRLGQNLFAIDPRAAEERVRALSWVREVQVARTPPDGVRIEVEEHRPVALVALEDLYYVDAEARAFRAYVTGEPIDLPIVLGVDRGGYERADTEAIRRLKSAIAFLKAWSSALGADFPLPRTVEVGAVGLVRYTEVGGATVAVGPAPWDEALIDARDAIASLGPGSRKGVELVVGRGIRGGRVMVGGALARATGGTEGR